jgi:hypothetical protein
MKRVMLILSLTLVPLPVMAQGPSQPGDLIGGVARPTTPASLSAPAEGVVASSIEVQPPPVPPPAPDVNSPRRRGSMVGYIDDAIVETKVRIRFDSGFHDNVPDRAEFFYAKCGCYRDLPPNNPNYDPSAPGPRPGAVSDLNFQHLFVEGEYAFTGRFSAFGVLPLRWIQPQAFVPGTGAGFPNQAGIGDLQLGAKYALVSESRQVITAKLHAFLQSGNSAEGLGTNHASLQPTLLAYQRFTDRLVLESEIADWHPLGGSAGLPTSTDGTFSGDVFIYGIGPSYELYHRNAIRVAPVVELFGWHVLSGFQTSSAADATGTNIVNLKVGARIVRDRQGSLYVGWGHALTSAHWYTNIVRLEYRYGF